MRLFEGQTADPFYGTNGCFLLKDKQLGHFEGQTVGSFGGTNE